MRVIFILFTSAFAVSSYARELLRLGIDNCYPHMLQKITKGNQGIWGLVTNQTGLDSHGVRTVKVLQARGISIRAIFAPEHGYHGKVVAGIHVADTVDEHTNIPVLSLYTKGIATNLNATTNSLVDPQVLQEINGFIVDLQDCGMRHYTYISALYQVMNQANVSKKIVVVLDRPNPLGARIEGPLVEPDLRSYISIAPIPLRYGLTMAELARYYNKYFFNGEVNLHIIRMTGYRRTDGLTKLVAPLSPNIASIDSCRGYSFLGLLGEIDPFDVGVKTPYAFCCIALPQSVSVSAQNWESLEQLLAKAGVMTERYEYISGTKKQLCKGVRITIADINKLKAFSLFLAIIELFKEAGVPLTFSGSFDKAVGTRMVQAWFNGQLSKQELENPIALELDRFIERAKPLLLYEPVIQT